MPRPLKIVSARQLRRLQESPEVRALIGGEIVDALMTVVRTSDYNVSFPNSPFGRDEAYDALDKLDNLLVSAAVDEMEYE